MENLIHIKDFTEQLPKESRSPAIDSFAEEISSLDICLTREKVGRITDTFLLISRIQLKDQLRFIDTVRSDLRKIQQTTRSECEKCMNQDGCKMKKI